jgi:hypothetical protein
VVEDLKVEPSPSCGVWQIGGRAKRKTAKIGEPLTARNVIYDGAVSAMVSSTLSQPYGEMIKQSEGDIQIGHTAVRGGAAKDAAISEEHVIENEIDHRRFGFRITEPLLVAAFGLIRASLPPGPEFDNRILHEMSKVIVKTLILPGGWIYQWTFGNPSGPWTSILDSLCNWLATSATLMQLGVKKSEFTLWVYGDDTLIGFKKWRAWRPNSKIQGMLRDQFGILPGDSSYGSLSSWGDEPGATFLGCWMKDGQYGRPLNKWLDVSVLPEKNTPGLAAQMKRTSYLSAAAVCTSDNRMYFESYFEWINSQMPWFAQYPKGEVTNIVNDMANAAQQKFMDRGVDTRQWEGGKKVRAEDTKSPFTNHGRFDDQAAEAANQTLLRANWLANPPGGGRRRPSIFGFNVQRLEPGRLAQYRFPQYSILRRATA